MENKSSFEIHTLESLTDSPIDHRDDTFKIFWFSTGDGTIRIDLGEYPIGPNVLFCLTPGQVFQWTPCPTTRGYFLSFTIGFVHSDKQDGNYLFVNNFFDLIFRQGIAEVSEGTRKDLFSLAENMIREFSDLYDGRGEVLRGFLKIFLVYLVRQMANMAKPEKRPATTSLTRKFFQLLELNYKTRKQVSDYAQDLSVTPNYLSYIVKQTSGLSATHHIHQRIVLEAKRKAAYVNVSMKEVAYSLGFDDQAHFSKFFKNVAGINFSVFKKEAVCRISDS